MKITIEVSDTIVNVQDLQKRVEAEIESVLVKEIRGLLRGIIQDRQYALRRILKKLEDEEVEKLLRAFISQYDVMVSDWREENRSLSA